MAITPQGARLTDVHRRRQIRTAIRADSALRRAMKTLDPSDIDGTRFQWRQRSLLVLQQYYGMSQIEARDYLGRFRLAELGTLSGPIVEPRLNFGIADSMLDVAGPATFKRAIADGVTEAEAYRRAVNQVLAEAHTIIMSAGRGLIRESGQADHRAVGVRRVSDGDPCTFCAMLVSRGPAYTSEAKALSKAGTSDPYHHHCGCTTEIIYGDWLPTEAEQGYIDAYNGAAEAANAAGENRTAQTVLWRMRDAGTFKDSPARRAVGK